MKLLSVEEYVALKGLRCPVCMSLGIYNPMGHLAAECEDSKALFECSCGVCKSTWVNHYELVGFTDLYIPPDDCTQLQLLK